MLILDLISNYNMLILKNLFTPSGISLKHNSNIKT